MMKAAIYNPYLDTLGGGERYTMFFAHVLSKNGYKVDVAWKNANIEKQIKERFGLDLSDVNFVPDIKNGDGYDLCFWVSDGSIPNLRARKNFLHFQVPFRKVGGKSLLNKMKLIKIDKIICNSNFTKKIIDAEYGVDSVVIYPPINVDLIKPKRKENVIIYVGRFSSLLQNKGQDVLIKAFKKLSDLDIGDWKLILVGGMEQGAEKYLSDLKKMASGYQIEIMVNTDFKTLKNLYGKSEIFWSASGYGELEDKFPEKVEHFGMTVVEAMSAGAVPIVYEAGGHKEIVTKGIDGEYWSTVGQLVSITISLIRNKKAMRELSQAAKISSQKFSQKLFETNVLSIVQN